MQECQIYRGRPAQAVLKELVYAVVISYNKRNLAEGGRNLTALGHIGTEIHMLYFFAIKEERLGDNIQTDTTGQSQEKVMKNDEYVLDK